MTIYWASTKSPVHLFARAYESPELARLLTENPTIDPAILAADLKIESLGANSIAAYQRRLGVRRITGNGVKP
jgi:hypothetical protein